MINKKKKLDNNNHSKISKNNYNNDINELKARLNPNIKSQIKSINYMDENNETLEKNLNGFLNQNSKLDSKPVLSHEAISRSNPLSKSEAEEAEKLKNKYMALKEIFEIKKKEFNSDRIKHKLDNNIIELQNTDLLLLESEIIDLNNQYKELTKRYIDNNFIDELNNNINQGINELKKYLISGENEDNEENEENNNGLTVFRQQQKLHERLKQGQNKSVRNKSMRNLNEKTRKKIFKGLSPKNQLTFIDKLNEKDNGNILDSLVSESRTPQQTDEPQPEPLLRETVVENPINHLSSVLIHTENNEENNDNKNNYKSSLNKILNPNVYNKSSF